MDERQVRREHERQDREGARHPARERQAALGCRESRAGRGRGAACGPERGECEAAQHVRQQAQRAEGADRDSLDREQHQVHEQRRDERSGRDERQRPGEPGRPDEGEEQQQRRRQIEREAPGGHGEAGDPRPAAARDFVAAARLALAAGLAHGGHGTRLAVVPRQQQSRDGRRGGAQDESRHDPLSRARLHYSLPFGHRANLADDPGQRNARPGATHAPDRMPLDGGATPGRDHRRRLRRPRRRPRPWRARRST